MGSIVRMDPKPPSSCWYMSRPSPQLIGQNRVLKGLDPPLKLCESNTLIIYFHRFNELADFYIILVPS